MWPKLFDLASKVSRKQVVRFDSKDFCYDEKFHVGDASKQIFKLGDRLPANIPSKKLKFHRQSVLRPSFAFSQLPHLASNHIQGLIF